MRNEGKAMIVSCDFAFCINNVGGKCKLDKISISMDGLCEDCFDRTKLYVAERILSKRDGK